MDWTGLFQQTSKQAATGPTGPSFYSTSSNLQCFDTDNGLLGSRDFPRRCIPAGLGTGPITNLTRAGVSINERER